ncbi:MAG: phosphoribosylanthranilate isomerase, partial [Alphaproteobacteria bacterium]
MKPDPQVKICGIKTVDALDCAVDSGADFLGFVFFPSSPRHVLVDQARVLCSRVPNDIHRVGLFVDPSDELLGDVLGAVALDMIQLHGQEKPERVSDIKAFSRLPVMKAFSVSEAQDVVRARTYGDVLDWYVFDAKAPAGCDVPGGTGQRFDWGLLCGEVFDKPWMLAGGLDAGNVGQALSVLSPAAVDVSS